MTAASRTAFAPQRAISALSTAVLRSGRAATSRHPQGLIGPLASGVVRRSLRAAAATGSGIRPAPPGDGEVNELLGSASGGALDSAAWVDAYDEYGRRAVGGSVLCPIEVKNVRHWIYPNAA